MVNCDFWNTWSDGYSCQTVNCVCWPTLCWALLSERVFQTLHWLCLFKDVTSWTSASKSDVFTGRPIKRLHHSAYSRRDFQYLGFSFPSVFKTLDQQYQKSLIRSLMEKMSFLWKPQMFYCCCLLHWLFTVTVNSNFHIFLSNGKSYIVSLKFLLFTHW